MKEPVTSVDGLLLIVEEVEGETAHSRKLWGLFTDRNFWKCRIISIKEKCGMNLDCQFLNIALFHICLQSTLAHA